jgi:hypothetical protein
MFFTMSQGVVALPSLCIVGRGDKEILGAFLSKWIVRLDYCRGAPGPW